MRMPKLNSKNLVFRGSFFCIAFGILPLSVAISCSKKKNSAPNQASILDQPISGVRDLPMLPTNPVGGTTPGRVQNLSEEESLRRKLANSAEPIVFGQSAGGISMDTTRDESRKILGNPLGSASGLVFYPSDLRVSWTPTQPSRPSLIVIGREYGGALDLVPSLGKIFMGQEFPDYFKPSDPKGVGLLQIIGRSLLGKTGTYDCLAFGTCRIISGESSIEFLFPQGSLIFDRASRALEVIYFVPPRSLGAPQLNQMINFGEDVAGIGIGTPRREVIPILGAPIAIEGPVFTFDNGNIIIQFDDQAIVTSIFLQRDFLGEVPTPSGFARFGQSFSSFFPGNDLRGERFIRNLARLYLNQGTTYDCLEELTCSIINDRGFIVFNIGNGGLVFSGSTKLLLGAFILPPEPAPTEPLTDDLMFGIGVGGVEFSSTKEDVEQRLGVSDIISNDGSTVFYDNRNLGIVWSAAVPIVPDRFEVRENYAGSLLLPDSIENRNMGDSFDSLFPGGSNGESFIKILGRFFEKKPDDYDCLAGLTCAIRVDGNLIKFFFESEVGSGQWQFSNDEFKTLKTVIMDRVSE